MTEKNFDKVGLKQNRTHLHPPTHLLPPHNELTKVPTWPNKLTHKRVQTISKSKKLNWHNKKKQWCNGHLTLATTQQMPIDNDNTFTDTDTVTVKESNVKVKVRKQLPSCPKTWQLLDELQHSLSFLGHKGLTVFNPEQELTVYLGFKGRGEERSIIQDNWNMIIRIVGVITSSV